MKRSKKYFAENVFHITMLQRRIFLHHFFVQHIEKCICIFRQIVHLNKLKINAQFGLEDVTTYVPLPSSVKFDFTLWNLNTYWILVLFFNTHRHTWISQSIPIFAILLSIHQWKKSKVTCFTRFQNSFGQKLDVAIFELCLFVEPLNFLLAIKFQVLLLPNTVINFGSIQIQSWKNFKFTSYYRDLTAWKLLFYLRKRVNHITQSNKIQFVHIAFYSCHIFFVEIFVVEIENAQPFYVCG